MLAISDVNSAVRPPFLQVPPPPWISKAPLFLIKKRGAKRPFEVAKAYATVRKKVGFGYEVT